MPTDDPPVARLARRSPGAAGFGCLAAILIGLGILAAVLVSLGTTRL